MVRQTMWLAGALLLATTGCLSRKTVSQKYYLIELPVMPSQVADRQPETEASCEIAPVEIFSAFAGTRIAVRMRTHELDYYAYHKWAARPAVTLTHLIENFLQNRLIFANASSQVQPHIPDYQLHTQVKQLEVVQQDDKLAAHLNVEFQLFDNSTNRGTVRHISDQLIPLKENDLNLFASAISQAFLKELQVLSEKITSYLHNQGPDQTSKL